MGVEVVELPVGVRSAERARLSPQGVRMCRLYVDGYSMPEVALLLGLAYETVKRHIRDSRAALVVRGYDVSTSVRLRKALRLEGLLEGVELI